MANDNAGVSVELTGTCSFCSFPPVGRFVAHGVPWCPRMPALCHVDWNGAHLEGEFLYHDLVVEDSFSRPVADGEIVVLFHTDGDYMATWGRVEIHGTGPRRFRVRETEPRGRYIYADMTPEEFGSM